MGLNLLQYQKIRSILLQNDCSFQTLLRLKTDYKEDINSQRVFEKITSLGYLLNILEKRDVIGYAQVNNLIQIVNKVAPENMAINNILFGGNNNHNNAAIIQPDNRMHEERGTISWDNVLTSFLSDLQTFSTMTASEILLKAACKMLPTVPTNTVERIHERIKSEMGHKWYEFGLALSLQEAQIDNLEYRYGFEGIPRMVHEMLSMHRERCEGNIDRWLTELQSALVRARRTDLSEAIDEIVAHSRIKAL